MTDRIALSLTPDHPNARWRWSLAGGGFSATGSVDAVDREDAVLCTLAETYDDLRSRGEVELVVSLPPTARLWSYVVEIGAHFAGVELVPFTEGDAELRAAAMRGLAPTPPPTLIPDGALVVATDGSATRGRIGWGWLAEDGRHGLGTDAPSGRICTKRIHPVMAELRAISRAIGSLRDRDLAIRSDSRPAIALVREWIEGSDRLPHGYAAGHHTAAKRDGLVWMQQQVRDHADRLDITWVRGHAGDPLNEGADSLAKLARRGAEGTWGFSATDVPRRATEIAAAFATQTTVQTATAA